MLRTLILPLKMFPPMVTIMKDSGIEESSTHQLLHVMEPKQQVCGCILRGEEKSLEKDQRSSQRRRGTQLRSSGVLDIQDGKEFQQEQDKGIDRGLFRKVDKHLRENAGYLKRKKP
ncbi:uncharacterized protein LOC144364918 [Ictidomys tridecemlineatus]